MLVGLARTSTIEQEAGLEAQKRILLAAGVEKLFVEPGFMDNCEEDPFTVSDVDTLLASLKG